MAVEHVSIVDAQRHEPKGASTALESQVYQSDGSESGAWRYQDAGLNVKMGSIGTAQSVWVVSPINGTIESFSSVINGALATADESITLEIGGVAVTAGGLTITQVGSAAGDVDTTAPSANNTVTAGQAIEVISAGNSTGTVDANFTLLIRGSTT